MYDTVLISYNWKIIGTISNQQNEIFFDHAVSSIGSTYEEAREIAHHLLRRKGMRFHLITDAMVSGIKFAYYKENGESIPKTDYPALPLPVIPPRL